MITEALGAAAPHVLKGQNNIDRKSIYDQLMEQVGFNHLPNKEIKTMNTVIHKANTRGHANHGDECQDRLMTGRGF